MQFSPAIQSPASKKARAQSLPATPASLQRQRKEAVQKRWMRARIVDSMETALSGEEPVRTLIALLQQYEVNATPLSAQSPVPAPPPVEQAFTPAKGTSAEVVRHTPTNSQSTTSLQERLVGEELQLKHAEAVRAQHIDILKGTESPKVLAIFRSKLAEVVDACSSWTTTKDELYVIYFHAEFDEPKEKGLSLIEIGDQQLPGVVLGRKGSYKALGAAVACGAAALTAMRAIKQKLSTARRATVYIMHRFDEEGARLYEAEYAAGVSIETEYEGLDWSLPDYI